jgi:hypothetical protein
MFSCFWPAVILAMILIFLHSVRASHKFTGPLYRLKLVLKALREVEISSPNQDVTEYREELRQNLSIEEKERIRDLTERADQLTRRLRYFKLAA